MKHLATALLIFSTFLSPSLRAEATISSNAYASLLTALVNDEGLIDYQGLYDEYQPELKTALQQISQVEASTFEYWENTEQIAFLLNAYNLFTLQVILENYPKRATTDKALSSIREIPGAWDKRTFSLLGKEITLNHIEHKMLREWYKEPRIHMALVCASVGCPPLRNEPYQSEQLNEQLTDQAQRFLARSRALRIDSEKKEIQLSPLFEWFKQDFSVPKSKALPNLDDTLQGVLLFILEFGPEPHREFIRNGNYKFKWMPYDWSLNDAGHSHD